MSIVIPFTACSESDSGPWEHRLNPGESVYQITADESGNLFAATSGDGGVYFSADQSTSWLQRNTGLLHTDVHALWFRGPTLFAGTNGGGVYRSTNKGLSWTDADSGITDTFVWCFAESDSGFFAAGLTPGGVYRSTNGGDSWVRLTTGLEESQVYALAVGMNNRLFAGCNTGVFTSTNNGDSWSAANTGLSFDGTGVTVENILVLPGGELYAGTSAGIFRSTNSGTDWEELVTATGLDIRTIARAEDGSVYAGTGIIGVIWSPNGMVWDNYGLSAAAVNSVFVHTDGYLYAGTFTGGIYRRKIY